MPRFPFIFTFALTTLVGCDDSLSQWDRVSVQVLSGVRDVIDPLVVDAGGDIVTNLAFERTALVEGTSLVSFQWESTNGGDILFGSPTEASTTIAAEIDGAYTVRVTARTEDGAEGHDEFLLTWDATGPVPSNTLQTLAGSASGPDVRVTRETTIVLSWGQATDAIVGLRDYTLTWYDAAACAGQATIVTGLISSFHQMTGAHGDVFSYRVTAIDELGQETQSDCSPSIRIDTQAPPALAALGGVTGTKLGEVALTLDLPADVSDYHQVTIRRSAGATAPPDCASGTAVKTLSAAELTSDPLMVADQTALAGSAFSYRVCIQDQAGNETGSDNVANMVSKHHYIFVSSSASSGSFGGLGVAGADAECEALAGASSLSEINGDPHWRAILSTSSMDAKDRIQIVGPITASDETPIADDAADMWDGSLDTAIGIDEDQNPVFSNVWTGTLSDGTEGAGTCNDWMDATGGVNGTVGDVSAFNGAWLDLGAPAACNTPSAIYCISQF